MRRFLPMVLLLALASPALAQAPQLAPPVKPWFIDDEKFFAAFMEKLGDLATDGKTLARDKLTAKMKPGQKARFTPAPPGERALSAEEVYQRALPSVFIIGSVYKGKDGGWVDGLYATAWVVGADGLLVTNWHVFEDLEEGEVFGAVDHKGRVYPVIDFLGGDKLADVAVVRIDARGLAPLPVADGYAAVGSWVGVLGHPGDNYYVFTQGHVTRYSTNKTEEGGREKWMGLTAEYAGGSSGSPVLNKYGAVVGMAALTLTIGDDGAPPPKPDRRRLLASQSPRRVKFQPPVAPPPREKGDDKPAPKGSGIQMILKMAVPGPTILRSFEK
jgi:S1-C subfamily serine protease